MKEIGKEKKKEEKKKKTEVKDSRRKEKSQPICAPLLGVLGWVKLG